MPVEHVFGAAKANKNKGRNQCGSALTCWAAPIDGEVLTSRNKFKTIDTSSVPMSRNGDDLPAALHRAPIAPRHMEADTKKLDLHRITGSGEASFYSTIAHNLAVPIYDMLNLRSAVPEGAADSLDCVWFCRLAHPTIILNKIGTTKWFIGGGDLCGKMTLGWPLGEARGPNGDWYSPRFDDEAGFKLITLHQPKRWQARSLHILSPLHQAVQHEQKATKADVVILKSSAHYGTMPMCLQTLGPTRSLLEVAAREAFWQLPISYIRLVLDQEEIEGPSGTLFEAVGTAGWAFIVGCDLRIINSVYEKRELSLAPDTDIEKISTLDDAIECLDKDDRQQLNKEISEAKNKKHVHEEFLTHHSEWKVTEGSQFWHEGNRRDAVEKIVRPPRPGANPFY